MQSAVLDLKSHPWERIWLMGWDMAIARAKKAAKVELLQQQLHKSV
jgi:hypothetical protein